MCQLALGYNRAMYSTQEVPVLEWLKSSTAAQHGRLEHLVDLLNPARTRFEYTALLRTFHAFYATVEPQVFDQPEWRAIAFDLEARRKLPLLERDLITLGAAKPLPCPQPPRLETFPHALGALYVMEGATLGGQVIGRHLTATLGLTPESGAAFFHSYGNRIGPMWLAFRTMLSTQVSDSETAHRVVEGALETFERFGTWLEQPQGSA
jgi:heme oxygenase (biliverdin-IX-beta and delta-forming)